MSIFSRKPNRDTLGDRNREILGDRTVQNHHLRIADKFVDLLNELADFRDLSTEQLLLLLPKKYRPIVPPVGENLTIREAARQEEERIARAVIIGMLATEVQIEHHLAQKFVERL